MKGRGLGPDVIKLDVEGYEPEAIQGMSKLLAGHVPGWVILEVATANARPKPAQVIDAMARYGYEGYRVERDGSLSEAVSFRPSENLCFVAPGRPT